MKQQLWIINSALAAIFAAVLIFSFLLKQDPPFIRKRAINLDEVYKEKPSPVVDLEYIYKERDIFDTFIPKIKKPKKETFVTPVPELITPQVSPPPPDFKQDFVEHLKIKLKGIVSSSSEENSIAMIADETNKERLYHLGDRVKDGQIIRIANNSIVILRANGQQEIFLLRKKDDFLVENSQKNLEYVIKQVDNFNYNIDPVRFKERVETLGQFLESVPMSTAYKNGEALGLRVGLLEKDSIGSLLGLEEKDLILSVNGVDAVNKKNRIKIYNSIIKSKIGDSVEVAIKRGGQEEKLNYSLIKIRKPLKETFFKPSPDGAKKASAGKFKLSKNQEREKRIRDFEKSHKNTRNKEMASEIRRRIFESMRRRSQNRRVR